jgi:putative ABC transport system permease protein
MSGSTNRARHSSFWRLPSASPVRARCSIRGPCCGASRAAEFAASNPASATLETEAIDRALLERVQALPGIAAARARSTVVASVLTANGWRTAIVYSSDDFTANRIGLVKSEAGAWPPADGSWIVEASSVEFAATAVGDSLIVQYRDQPAQRLVVAGIARDVGLAPGWMEHIVYGFATPGTLAALGAATAFDELQILVVDRSADRDAVRRIASEVRAVVEKTGRTVRRDGRTGSGPAYPCRPDRFPASSRKAHSASWRCCRARSSSST